MHDDNKFNVKDPSCVSIHGQPDDCFEMVNKYGTYQIQPTSDTQNIFPAIAQGLPDTESNRKEIKRNR